MRLWPFGRAKSYGYPAADFFRTFASLLAANPEKLTNPWDEYAFVRSAIASVYRVVRGVPLVGKVGVRSKRKDAKDVGDDSPVSLLLVRPNPIQDGGEFGASLVAFLMMYDATYAVLYGKGSDFWEPTSRDLPREMLPVPTASVKPSPMGIDKTTGLITEYEVAVAGGMPLRVPASSMLVIRNFNPNDLQCPTSPLLPVWSAMSADRSADQHQASLLANGATPGTHVKIGVGVTDKERIKVRAQFDDRHKGAAKAGRTIATGPDVEIAPFPAQTAKDMQMTATREWSRDAVKAVLGVTDYEVGQEQDYSRAASENARAWLWTNTLLPMMESVENALWSQVFEPISRGQRTATWIEYDTSDVEALKPQLATTAVTAQTLIATGFDPSQVSEKLGLGLDFVDVYDEPEPEPPAPPVDTPPPEPPPPTPTEPAKSGPTIIVRSKKVATKPITAAVALRLHEAWAKHAERKLGVRWRKFTAARYAETVAKVRALSHLGHVGGEIVDGIMGSAEAWRSGSEAAARAGMRGIGPALGENMRLELGGFSRIDVGQDIYEALAVKRVGQMVQVGAKLRSSIRASIAKTIADAGTEGVGISDLEKILEAKFKGRLPSNAATVARTETGIFASDVRRGIMVAQGVDEHMWSASMDQHTRETHRAVDGERRPIGERFSNGMLHPLEAGAPASEVVNCRCVELPYMKEAQ